MQLPFNSKLLFAFFFVSTFVFSQSAPIKIDGNFEDWTTDLATFYDTNGENLNGVDLEEFQVTNDENYLYIRIKVNQEIDITDESLIDHNITLSIDTDNNENTGFATQDLYGTEISVVFTSFFAHYNVTPYSQVDLHDIGIQAAPTVTSDEFEIAIPRNSVPDNTNNLFTNNTIKIVFKNLDNNDAMPNIGSSFSYTFDETLTAVHAETLDKENNNFIRVLSYNTEQNGLSQTEKHEYFERVISAINPDIIGFVESSNAYNIKGLLDQWIPLGTPEGWYVYEYDGVVTASKWEITQRWFLDRQFPVLIDLPESYGTDLLFTNSHLYCCTADDRRQEQVDEYAAFILDAKSEGGDITLPENTPFIYAGDLNLVGYSQQLTTLLTGDIRFTNFYGEGAPLDWDETDVTSDDSLHNNKSLVYTWRNYNASFLPGKLDFIIYADSVLEKEKSFVLETETQSNDILTQNGLELNDTFLASDHLPVVADFSIKNETLNTVENADLINTMYPNPTSGIINISLDINNVYSIRVFDILGNIVTSQTVNTPFTSIDISNFSNGIYNISIEAKNGKQTQKIIKQ